MAELNHGYRIQPGVEKWRDQWQTFKNLKDWTVDSDEWRDFIVNWILIDYYTQSFESWWTEADRPYLFFDIPELWRVPGQLALLIWFTEIADGARTIDISINTWIENAAPVVIAGPAQFIIPLGTDLIRGEIPAFAVDLTGIDLLGILVENVSNPAQTDYWVPSASLIFVPDVNPFDTRNINAIVGPQGGA